MRPDPGEAFSFRLRLISWLPAAGLMAAIFWLSSIPGDTLPLPDFRFSDKAAHFLAYGVLGALIAARLPLRGLIRRGPGSAPVAPAVPWAFDRLGAAVGVLYGITDEVHQLFVPMRMFAVSDLVADGFGVVCGIWVFSRLAERRLAGRPARALP